MRIVKIFHQFCHKFHEWPWVQVGGVGNGRSNVFPKSPLCVYCAYGYLLYCACCMYSGNSSWSLLTKYLTKCSKVGFVNLLPTNAARWSTLSLTPQFFLYFAPWRGAKYCDEYVCLSVCLSARKPHCRTSPKTVCVLAVAMTRPYSHGDMYTSGFVDDIVFLSRGVSGPESNTTLYFGEFRQMAVPVGRQTITVYCVW